MVDTTDETASTTRQRHEIEYKFQQSPFDLHVRLARRPAHDKSFIMDSFTDADALIEDDDEAEQNLVIQATNVISFQLLREVSGESDLSKAISVNLHGKQLCQIQALESCPNLRMLDLSFNRIRKLDGLSTLTKLKELKLYDNLIPVIENCAQLTALHTLDISSNRLASLEPTAAAPPLAAPPHPLAMGPAVWRSTPLPCIAGVQGIACLRGLKVLRCAYNGLSSLEGLGRATQLESLDAAFNKADALPLPYPPLPFTGALQVCELGSSLSSCVALRELVLDGNGLSSLRGLQRCDKLEELRVADNALSSLQGLRAAAGSLDTLDCTRNQLSSLEGLAEGCLRLHELYAAENRLTSLEGLALKAPALETLDVSGNPLHAATPAAPPGVAGSRRSSTNGVTPSSPPSPSPSLTPQPSADLAPSKRLQHGHKPGRSAAAARPSPMPLPPAASAPAAKAGKRPASTAGSASRVAGNTAASVSLSAGRASAGEAGGATPGPSASEAAGAEGLAPSLAALIAQLQLLPDLTSVRLEGCAGLPQPGVYQPLLLQAVSSLEAVDDVERPPPHTPVPAAAEAAEARGKGTAGQGGEQGPEEGKLGQADLWVNAGDDQGPDLEQIDNCPTAFIPTIQEIEAFKQRMGINSQLPVMGRPASAKTGTAAADRGSTGQPSAAAGGPRPSSSSGSRPGSALLTRPGSAISRVGAGNRAGAGGVRDALMHQRPASARMGGGARLMDPEQYSNAVDETASTTRQRHEIEYKFQQSPFDLHVRLARRPAHDKSFIMDSFTDADALIEDDDEAEQNLVIQATNVISFQLLREVSGESDLSKAISVNLHGKQLCQIQALESCPNLRMLDLSFNRIRKLDGLSTLTKLKELKLYDNLIPVIENCAQLTALHTLDISSNRLASLEPTAAAPPLAAPPHPLAMGPAVWRSTPLPCIAGVQGIACLRGLKVLRCAYNGLSSLEGLGRATQLESLDAAFNKADALPLPYPPLPFTGALQVCELGSSLSSCVALRELVLDGNGLSSLRGLQRCDKLEELRVADNALSSLQGLRAAAGSLDTLDCTRNQLSSLEGLAEGCLRLHELYAAENRLTSLEGLALKAPALETL
ncbi:hypothetical protein QJQ45_015904, partial [Haematococcus lacustris]